MCELFAMSSSRPTTVRYSLPEFARHGALTRSNRSGWGIAYYQGPDAVLVKEPSPAGNSPWVRFIADQDIASDCVIAHVRLATIGEPSLQNTHPFRRPLGGRAHIMAHNGTMRGLHEAVDHADLTDGPIGDTDSELAFCFLLEKMRKVWTKVDGIPAWQARFERFVETAGELAAQGTCNILYSDGDALFAHAHKRIYERADGEFGEAEPPGLSIKEGMICDLGTRWSCHGLEVGGDCQETILLASVPLDEEGWEPLPEASAIAVRQGRVLEKAVTV